MLLTRKTVERHQRLRRQFVRAGAVGAPWTVLASDTVLTACRLAGVAPAELLLRLHSRYSIPEVRRGTPVFAAMLRQMPGCIFLRLRSGVLQARCHGLYCEDMFCSALADESNRNRSNASAIGREQVQSISNFKSPELLDKLFSGAVA